MIHVVKSWKRKKKKKKKKKKEKKETRNKDLLYNNLCFNII